MARRRGAFFLSRWSQQLPGGAFLLPRRRQQPAGVVEPPALAALAWWFHADALVLANDDPVATWADSSGQLVTADQATGGLQPLFKTAVQNGLPAVLPDGTDDRMATGSLTLGIGAASDVCAFAVVKTGSAQAGYRSIWALGSYSPAFYLIGGKVGVYLGADNLGATALTAETVYTLFWERVGDTGVLTYYINGTADANTFINGSVMPDGVFTLFAEAAAGGSPGNMHLFEAGFYKALLTGPERTALFDYLRTKYAHY